MRSNVIETKGDIFEQGADALCIPTDGLLTPKGLASCNKGIARLAAQFDSDLTQNLGHLIKTYGNHIFIVRSGYPNWISFPVKPASAPCNEDYSNVLTNQQSKFAPGDLVPANHLKADPNLILRSAQELLELTDARGWTHVMLPRPPPVSIPWPRLKKDLDSLLDDRFYLILP